MILCSKCGAKVEEGVRFCTECGAAIAPASAAVIAQPAVAPSAVAQPIIAPPVTPIATAVRPAQPTPTPTSAHTPSPSSSSIFGQAGSASAVEAPPANSPYAVMSMRSFLAHSLFFSIPVLGWLVCLVMAFAVKNQNKRNYARASLVLLLIGLILSLLFAFVFNMAAQMLIDGLNEASGGALGQVNGLPGLLDLLKSYSGIQP